MVRYGKVLFTTPTIEVVSHNPHWQTFFAHYVVRQRNDGWYLVHRIKQVTGLRTVFCDKRGIPFASLDFAKRYARTLYKRVERREDQ